jgi:hypothetical protein
MELADDIQSVFSWKWLPSVIPYGPLELSHCPGNYPVLTYLPASFKLFPISPLSRIIT